MRVRPEAQCALRVMVALAHAAAGDAHLGMTVETLAESTNITSTLVRHTLLMLERARMVRAQPHGYELGFHPRAIYVADIIDGADLLLDAQPCPLATPGCGPDTPCPLCWKLLEADIAAAQVLRTQTLADLVRAPYSRPGRATPSATPLRESA